MGIYGKTFKSRKKWEFMGNYGKFLCILVNEFKIFFRLYNI